MTLDRPHLELLRALTETATLAAAAEAINLSPSAASRRLQDAERRIGMTLVEPDGRTLQLTAAGRVLAESANRILEQLTEAELTARWLGSGATAPIRVGVGFHDQIAWALPDPDEVAVELVRSPTPRAVDALTRRRVDLVIDVAGTGHHEGHTLLDDRLALVVGADHPLADHPVASASDIVHERYFASDPTPLPGFELERLFVPSGHSPATIVRVESFATSIALVARGDGVSIQPRQAAIGAAHPRVRVVELDTVVPVQWFARTADHHEVDTDTAIEAIAQIMQAAGETR